MTAPHWTCSTCGGTDPRIHCNTLLSADGEMLGAVGSSHDVGEHVGRGFDGFGAEAVGQATNVVDPAPEVASKQPGGRVPEITPFKADIASCVFENNVFEEALSEFAPINLESDVPERLTFVIHGNRLLSEEDEGSSVDGSESIS